MPDPQPAKSDTERIKTFFMVVRTALLMVVVWIESEYNLEPSGHYRKYFETKYGRRLAN